MIGQTNSISLDDIIKHIRPPRCNTDEHRGTINKNIQCLKQLPNSWQTIGVSSKLIFMSPEALQKGH